MAEALNTTARSLLAHDFAKEGGEIGAAVAAKLRGDASPAVEVDQDLTYRAAQAARINARMKKMMAVPDKREFAGKNLLVTVLASKAGAATHDPVDDKRFPNVNQNHNCWTALNEFQLCVQATDEWTSPACAQRRRDFLEVCPSDWIEEWESQMDEGKWMGIDNNIGPAVPDGEDDDDDDEDDEDDE